MVKDLSLLGLEPQALKNEELGEEEDAKYLGHTVGLEKFLKDMEKHGKEIHDRLKLASLIIETSLRNIYGCPMSVCYWSPPNSKVAKIKMTNTSLQLVSEITIDFNDPYIEVNRFILNNLYGSRRELNLDKLKQVIHDALEWAAISPNPQTPLFFNKKSGVCVFVDYDGVKVFKKDSVKSYNDDGLVPDWARQVSKTWKDKHATAVYTYYRNQETIFTKLSSAPPKVSGVIVIDQDQ